VLSDCVLGFVAQQAEAGHAPQLLAGTLSSLAHEPRNDWALRVLLSLSADGAGGACTWRGGLLPSDAEPLAAALAAALDSKHSSCPALLDLCTAACTAAAKRHLNFTRALGSASSHALLHQLLEAVNGSARKEDQALHLELLLLLLSAHADNPGQDPAVADCAHSVAVSYASACVSLSRSTAERARWLSLLAVLSAPVAPTANGEPCPGIQAYLAQVLQMAAESPNAVAAEIDAAAQLMRRGSLAVRAALQALQPPLLSLLESKHKQGLQAAAAHALGLLHNAASLATAYGGEAAQETEMLALDMPPDLPKPTAASKTLPSPVVASMEQFQQAAAQLLQLERELGERRTKPGAPQLLTTSGALVMTPTASQNLQLVRDALLENTAPLLLEGSTGATRQGPGRPRPQRLSPCHLCCRHRKECDCHPGGP
jgi:hypothetical protein